MAFKIGNGIWVEDIGRDRIFIEYETIGKLKPSSGIPIMELSASVVNIDIEKYVADNKLKEFSYGSIGRAERGVTAKMSRDSVAASSMAKPYEGIDGGLRVPHLHHNGNIYLLNRKQWKEFSAKMVEGFIKKLAEANTVGFEQLMELGNVVSRIP